MEFEARGIQLSDGEPLVLRAAEPRDAQDMLRFLHEEIATSPYVLTVPQDITYTLEQETELIEQKRDDPRSLFLLALINDEIVGASSLFSNERFKTRHNADLGTTVARAWRGRGIGRIMLEMLIEWARANPEILRLTLDVMTENTKARRMYDLVGFREIGVERRAYRQPDGTFLDGSKMDMWVG